MTDEEAWLQLYCANRSKPGMRIEDARESADEELKVFRALYPSHKIDEEIWVAAYDATMAMWRGSSKPEPKLQDISKAPLGSRVRFYCSDARGSHSMREQTEFVREATVVGVGHSDGFVNLGWASKEEAPAFANFDGSQAAFMSVLSDTDTKFPVRHTVGRGFQAEVIT